MNPTTQETQDWIEAYKELCNIIKQNCPNIQHVDLWHDQFQFESEEYPFPEKTVFLDFNAPSIDSVGIRAQDMNMLVGVIFAFDTLSDTFAGSDNQEVALEFGKEIRVLHAILQARSGNNFSALNRVALTRETAPDGCIAYRQTYTCIVRDYSPLPESVTYNMEQANVGLEVQKQAPPAQTNMELYTLPGM